jgi:AraC family transcriptional regulator, positive regulator of tynA and feaB
MRTLVCRSTDEVPAHDRVRYWRDSVHEAVVEMDLMPTIRSDFFSRIELCPMTNVVPHRAEGSPQKISRGRSEIVRGNKNTYYLISQSRVAWRSQHAGRDEIIHPGESVLIDSRIPYSFEFPQGLDDLSIELPVSWVERWLPDPLLVIGRALPATMGWGLALRGVKEGFAPFELARTSQPDELLEDQLGTVLALASGAHAPESPDHDLLDRCLQATRDLLVRPGLTATEIAIACGISVRTLHRTFAAAGRTFAGSLMHFRTQEAARMLADRRFRMLPIAEVARRCGFLDPSHFARQFRRVRGVGPCEFRRDAVGPTGHRTLDRSGDFSRSGA